MQKALGADQEALGVSNLSNIALEHTWAFSNHPAINVAHLVRPFTHQYSIIYGTLVSRVAFTLPNGSIQHYEVLKAKIKQQKQG